MNTTLSANPDQHFKDMVTALQSFGEDEQFSVIDTDLLPLSLQELVGSPTFSTLPGERRKDLFNQYLALRGILSCLTRHLPDAAPAINKGESITNLTSTLQSFGEDGQFPVIETDLLPLLMQELIGSEVFNSLSSERRKDLFNQSETLTATLECLGASFTDYPGVFGLPEDLHSKN